MLLLYFHSDQHQSALSKKSNYVHNSRNSTESLSMRYIVSFNASEFFVVRFERCKTPMGTVPISVIMGFDYPLDPHQVKMVMTVNLFEFMSRNNIKFC